jgi:hypothetical protein
MDGFGGIDGMRGSDGIDDTGGMGGMGAANTLDEGAIEAVGTAGVGTGARAT